MEVNAQSTYGDRLQNAPPVPILFISSDPGFVSGESGVNKHGYPVIDVAFGGITVLSILLDVTEFFCVRPMPKNPTQLSFSVEANIVLSDTAFSEGRFDSFDISACMGGLAVSFLESDDLGRNKRLPRVTSAIVRTPPVLQKGIDKDNVVYTAQEHKSEYKSGKQEIGRQMYGTSIHQLPGILRGRVMNVSHQIDIVMQLTITESGTGDNHSLFFTTSSPLVVNIINETVQIPTIKCIPLRRMILEPLMVKDKYFLRYNPTGMNLTHLIKENHDLQSLFFPFEHIGKFSPELKNVLLKIETTLSANGRMIYVDTLSQIDAAFMSYFDQAHTNPDGKKIDKFDKARLREVLIKLLLNDGHPTPEPRGTSHRAHRTHDAPKKTKNTLNFSYTAAGDMQRAGNDNTYLENDDDDFEQGEEGEEGGEGEEDEEVDEGEEDEEGEVDGMGRTSDDELEERMAGHNVLQEGDTLLP